MLHLSYMWYLSPQAIKERIDQQKQAKAQHGVVEASHGMVPHSSVSLERETAVLVSALANGGRATVPHAGTAVPSYLAAHHAAHAASHGLPPHHASHAMLPHGAAVGHHAQAVAPHHAAVVRPLW